MTTEAQFTRAIEKVVATRGPGWKYPSPTTAPPGYYVKGGGRNPAPTYRDNDDNPTCLIGAVMRILGMYLPDPSSSPSALSVLMSHVPTHVAIAARCAQVHQDHLRTWGEALAVYQAALEYMATYKENTFGVFDAELVYRQAIRKIEGKAFTNSLGNSMVAMKDLSATFTALSETKVSFDGFATGGTITGGTLFGGKGSITYTMPPSLAVASYFVEEPLTKKDHALIA